MPTEPTSASLVPHLFKGHGHWIMQDSDTKREWLFPETPRYYIHQREDGKWEIIDRWTDLVVREKTGTRSATVRAFYKLMKRPIPEGTSLPSFKGSNFKGV